MNYKQEEIKPYGGKEEKHVLVERMFDNIASSYDRLNHTLSFGIDKRWRRKAIKCLLPHHPKKLLDIATGTGDFAIQSASMLPQVHIMATDISEGMMDVGRKKVKDLHLDTRISFQREDSTALTFDTAQFDGITVAFGIRNFQSLDTGLSEMHRVLKEGGRLVILELSYPTHFPMRQGYWIYSKAIMPMIGRMISGDKDAYSYLPASIEAFPQGEVMKEILLKAGFKEVNFTRLTLGVCTLYEAIK